MSTTQTLVQVPASLPLLSLTGEIDNPTWRGNSVREDALMEMDEYEDDTQEDIDNRKANIIERLELKVEDFEYTLDATETDSIGETIRCWTSSSKGVQTFAAQHEGLTLAQLLRGVRYEGGRVYCEMNILVEDLTERIEGGAFDDITEAELLPHLDEYKLQADGTFKLAC